MIIKSTSKNVKGSPRKLRIPARVVKGMNALDAVATLNYIPKDGARLILKTISTAIADAKNNFGKKEENLIVVEVRIDEALKLSRFRPAAKGMAKPYIKKFSNITAVLKDITESEEDKVIKSVKKQKDTKIEDAEVVSTTKEVAAKPKKEAKKKEVKVKEKPIKAKKVVKKESKASKVK